MTFQYNGKTYALVKQEDQSKFHCKGCAFKGDDAGCSAAPECGPQDSDGDHQVFKEVPCSPT